MFINLIFCLVSAVKSWDHLAAGYPNFTGTPTGTKFYKISTYYAKIIFLLAV